ncbi:protein tumorous imaginal discs, mitochondrial, partial [Ixodes scapularis]
VARSDYFRRDGPDVHTDAGITLSQAVLGGTVRVQGIYDDIMLKIPAGTSSHTKIRLANKGVKRLNSSGYGDHYVHIKIRIPQCYKCVYCYAWLGLATWRKKKIGLILSDDSKRQQYDQWGTTSDFPGGAGAGAGAGAGSQGTWGPGGFHSTIDPEELFRKIFGDLGSRTGFSDFDFSESQFGFGGAQEVILNLTFQQAARGVNKDVNVNVVDTCPRCQGSRSEPGSRAVRCPYCNGSGMETISTGPFVMRSTCRHCHGSRMHIQHPCQQCHAKGTTVQRKMVTVPVPAGVEDGQTVRMQVGKKELFVTFK